MDEITIARATEDDVRAIARRREFGETAFRLALVLQERGTVWAARDDAQTVGVAMAHDSEEERYIGDLFVEPSYRGQGVGRRLLDAAFADADDVSHAMLVSASDAASLALAMRFGCVPTDVLVSLSGAIPREEELAKMAAGDYRFEVDAIDPAVHEFALNALDREARGTTRSLDHQYFSRHAFGQVFALDGEPIAYAYVWPDGRIGPMACASQAYLVQIFGYVLVTLRRHHAASWCSLLVPGANLRIARAALRAGLRIAQLFSFAGNTARTETANYLAFHQLLL